MSHAPSSAVVVLATVLLVGGVLKAASARPAISSTAFASLVRRPALVAPAWYGLAMLEVADAVGLVVLRHSLLPLVVATLLFGGGIGYLLWSLARRPGEPCGCLGARVAVGVSWRAVTRTCLLTGLATLALSSGGTWPGATVDPLDWLTAPLLLMGLWALSPELPHPRRLLLRLRTLRTDCSRAPVPVDSALKLLKKREVWHDMAPYLGSNEFADQWRVGCWRLFAFNATAGTAPATAVFAVRLARRHEAITGVVVDDETDDILAQRAAGSLDAAPRLARFA